MSDRLKWTKDEPTKPGWYWEECIALDVPCKPRVIEVRNDYRSGQLTGHATIGLYKWAGPIETPEE